jgi:GTPase SAR1 family protein
MVSMMADEGSIERVKDKVKDDWDDCEATTSTFGDSVAEVPAQAEDDGKRSRANPDRRVRIQEYYEQKQASDSSTKIVPSIKDLYKNKLLPIELKYHLHSFCLPISSEIPDADFDARPMVLILGPYSTGKTSFIRHLLGGGFPGIHIGPEPTTDKFLALVHGGENDNEESDTANSMIPGKIVKGNTLTVTPELPFASIATFGSAFLNHFNGSVCSAPLLRNVTIVDTPGVLSGAKQRIHREYDFAQVAKWFADRSDLILLLFDAHKLDISDELKEVVETIRPHNDDKIRCILNKADGVERQELVRVYGSLMWNMGKLFNSPEVVRVYTGSYWDKPFCNRDFTDMFEEDERLLIRELINLPSTSTERKVNNLVKRIRLVKVHICILGYLRRQMPRWFGKSHARVKLMLELDQVFQRVRTQYVLSTGDMPDVEEFRKCLEDFDDFTVFPIPDQKTLQELDQMILRDIPAIMKGSGGVSNANDLFKVVNAEPAEKRLMKKLSDGGIKEMEEPTLIMESVESDKSVTLVRRLVLSLSLGALIVFALMYSGVLLHDAVRAIMKQIVDIVRVTAEQVNDAMTLA